MDREIPIVADDYADLEFGTGAVKMTPAHDPNDFEVAQRHDLPIIRVLNDDGTMNENAGKFAGMTREACREAVVEELKKLGLLVKVEPLKHNVGTCYRCHDNVEPLVSHPVVCEDEAAGRARHRGGEEQETGLRPRTL